MFERIFIATTVVVVAILGSAQYAFAEPVTADAQEAILITGANAGIGRTLPK